MKYKTSKDHGNKKTNFEQYCKEYIHTNEIYIQIGYDEGVTPTPLRSSPMEWLDTRAHLYHAT